MTILKIRTYPDPILQKKAEPVSRFGTEEQRLFDDMIKTMYTADGVGLAAPQVGISKRILVASPTMTQGEEYVFINPEILEARGREMGLEGCLSLPGISGEIPRAKVVRFRALDREGKPLEIEVKDFFARIIQHEIDHLNGVLLIDRVDFDKRQELLASYQRL
ncbi:MAG: peptide deformylase [Candidatus Omnitrophica bacterium]|nr:peptide deformylase [Candidatus Omnitrophota bacterium]